MEKLVPVVGTFIRIPIYSSRRKTFLQRWCDAIKQYNKLFNPVNWKGGLDTIDANIDVVKKQLFYKQYAWEMYIDKLRFDVLPLIKKLEKEKFIESYHFLVHNKHGFNQIKDDGCYIHLRLNCASEAICDKLIDGLPSFCEYTVKERLSDYVGGIDMSYFETPKVFWELLNCMSALVELWINSHDPDRKFPAQHAGMLDHYIRNMLLMK